MQKNIDMQTIDDYATFLATIRNVSGIESLVPDASGLVSVRVEDTYNLNLQFVEATGKILCFVEVAQLPPDAPREVYRDLLAGGLFGRETAGGYFALDPETETVVYNYFFDLDKAAADPEEFVSTLEKILQLCDIWAERIRRDLHGEGHEGDDSRNGAPARHEVSFRLDP